MKTAVVAAALMMVGTEAAMRTLTIKNSCPASVGTIRVGFTAGSPPRPGCKDGEDCSIPCKTTSQCPAGSFCSTVGHCFYNSFLPGNFVDLPFGSYPVYYNITISDAVKLYSGTVFGSTGCDNPVYKNACETAICPGKVCEPDKGSSGPRTIAEFTFDSHPEGSDFYDVSFIDGLNVPMSMKPIGNIPSPSPTDPYYCAASGAFDAAVCPYAYRTNINGTDLPTDMVFVAADNLDPDCTEGAECPASGNRCTSSSQCTVSGEVCGLAAGRDPTGLQTNKIPKVCGRPVGLWSARAVCSYIGDVASADIGAPYNCQAPTWLGKKEDLYLCQKNYAQSGYQEKSAIANTCGCINWPNIHASKQCVHDTPNPEWEWYSLPWLRPFKKICQTAYTYPYDDEASTFTCKGSNFLAHEIEFCPSGVTLHKV